MNNENAVPAGFVRDPETGEYFSPHHYRVKRARPGPVLQEQKEDPRLDGQGNETGGGPEREDLDPEGEHSDPEPALPGAGDPRLDGSGYVPYRVTITLRHSNFHRKDPDGCLATLADCYVAAVRRLLDELPGSDNQKRVVRSRTRGGNDQNRATIKGNLPF